MNWKEELFLASLMPSFIIGLCALDWLWTRVKRNRIHRRLRRAYREEMLPTPIIIDEVHFWDEEEVKSNRRATESRGALG